MAICNSKTKNIFFLFPVTFPAIVRLIGQKEKELFYLTILFRYAGGRMEVLT